MANQNSFVWYELMTTDLDAAEAFYGAVIGWSLQDAGAVGMRYTLLKADGVQVGGAMALPEAACAAGAKPAWIGYIGVADVDAAAARLTAAGGSIHRAPGDIPNVGRFAIVADPQGAAFCLFTSQNGGSSESYAMGKPGHAGWNELHSSADAATAFAFYVDQFGWVADQAMPMGEMGIYQLFKPSDAAATPIGAVLRSPKFPRPAWLFYWGVEDIDAAAKRVADHGGQIQLNPVEVPGGAWIVQATDPQGALFALLGPRKA